MCAQQNKIRGNMLFMKPLCWSSVWSDLVFNMCIALVTYYMMLFQKHSCDTNIDLFALGAISYQEFQIS